LFLDKAWVWVDAPSIFNHTPDDPWGHVVSDYAEPVPINKNAANNSYPSRLWWKFALGGELDVEFNIDAYIDFLDIHGNHASYFYAKKPISYSTHLSSYCDLCNDQARKATNPTIKVSECNYAVKPIVSKRMKMIDSSAPLRYNAKQKSVISKRCENLPADFKSQR
jgi:hypothetical protein